MENANHYPKTLVFRKTWGFLMLAEDYKPPIASSRPATWPVHGGWYRKRPFFPHNFTRFSQGAQPIKSAIAMCVKSEEFFPAVFWPGGSEPDLWGEWLLLWRPIRSPVRWATVAKANLRQGGWNEGKRGDVANTKYMLKYIHIHMYIYIQAVSFSE